MSTKATSQPVPSYYPPGWDRERVVNTTSAELDALPPEVLLLRARPILRPHEVEAHSLPMKFVIWSR